MDYHLRAELCERASLMAIQRRQPPRGLIHHSDRRVQYARSSYQKISKRHGLTLSMSRKGNRLDNAPMESFSGSLKSELVHRACFDTHEDAKRPLFWWIENFYNRRRRHSALGYMTPAQAFEMMPRAASCILPRRPPKRCNVNLTLGSNCQRSQRSGASGGAPQRSLTDEV